MKPLIKVIVIIGLCFAATFVLIKATGVLSIEQIEGWLKAAKAGSPIYVGGIVTALLFADLFIAVPTLTITILAGYFLGLFYGIVATVSGFMLAGVAGYGLSRYFGDRILRFLVRDGEQRQEAKTTFEKHGFVMILLSRAVPILPEVTACMAGMTGMSFPKFLAAWSISSVPYATIAVYAGSVSSLDNPKPAILAAIAISSSLWVSWYLFHRYQKQNRNL